MGDESGQPTVVSTSSSHENFVGLAVAGESSTSTDHWAPSKVEYNNNSSMNNNHSSMQQQEQQVQGTTDNVTKTTSQHSTPSLTSTMPPNFPSGLIVSKSPLPILPSAGLAVPAAPTNNTVPEFLYQLTKMLTGGHNDIIEWSNGRIEVHNPHKLESIVLQKYFRHSKFASFQRQLNYFGFRKLAGKGKMAPCSYVNEAATQEIGSLLLIKRKPTIAPKDKNGRKQAAGEKTGNVKGGHVPHNTAKGVTHQVKSSAPAAGVTYQHHIASNVGGNQQESSAPVANTQHAIAQAAVGRGIRHSIFGPKATSGVGVETMESSSASADHQAESSAFFIPTGVEDSLSQLANNYQNSLVDAPQPEQIESHSGQNTGTDYSSSSYDPFPSLLSRNSSLVDLAMLPTLDDDGDGNVPNLPGMSFVDFPQPEVDPSKVKREEATG